jgi:hypothetical protein
MYPADEAHGARRKRRLIVAEKGAGARKGDSQIVRIDSVAKISGGGRRGVLRAKDAEDKSSAIDDSHDHVDVHGVDGSFDDVLNVGDLKRLDYRRRRRGDRGGSSSAANQQHEERGGNAQGQQDAKSQDSSVAAERVARVHWPAQFVKRSHCGVPSVGNTEVRARSTELRPGSGESVNGKRCATCYRMCSPRGEKYCSGVLDIVS